jgi:hypothetical protein
MKLHLGKKGINKQAEGRKRINKEKKLQGRKEGRKEGVTKRKPNMNKNKNWGNRKERKRKHERNKRVKETNTKVFPV